jgi:hypothetical protein
VVVPSPCQPESFADIEQPITKSGSWIRCL